MTLEELEILIKAKIEDAKPQITKMLKQVKDAVNNSKGEIQSAVNTTSKVMQKVNTQGFVSKITKAVQVVKDRINNLKKSTQNNELELKVNNKSANQQITQLEKEIDSLQKKISSRQMKLDIINPQIDSIVSNTKKEVIPQGVSENSPVMDKVVNNSLASNKEFTSLNNQANKLYTEIEMFSNQLDTAKSKVSQLKKEFRNVGTSQSKLTSFFSAFKSKLQGAISNAGGLKKVFNQLPRITQKVTNNIKNIGTGFKTGLKHVLKYAMALFSLRGIYSVLSNSASSWLSSQNSAAKQMTANIEYMKYAMGSAFAPVIQYVINLVYKLMKAIQSVVYALTGVNIFAKASAKSYNAMANGAKKAKKETQGLADIDEIHNIQKDTNSDSDSGTTTPNMDLSKLNNTPTNIIDALKKGDWKNIGSIIAEKINQAMYNIPWEKIQKGSKQIANGIANFLNGFIGTLDWKEVGNTFAQGINTIIYFGLEFVTTFDWSQFGKAIGEAINGFFENVDWQSLAKWFGESINGIISTIHNVITTINWTEIATNLSSGINELFSTINWSEVGQTISDAITNLFWSVIAFLATIDWGQIGTSIGQFLTSIDWMSIIGEVLIIILLAIGGISEALFNLIGEICKGIGQWLYDGLIQPIGEIFSTLWEVIKGIWNSIKTTIIKVATTIKDKVLSAFNTLKSKIKSIFTGIKTTIKSIWDGIWNAIKKVINSILGGIEKMANGVVKGMNKVIGVLNNLQVHIPDWIPMFGGKDIGFHISEMSQISIPKLATGTNYIPKEGIYHLHEGEAVIPKKYNPDADSNNANTTAKISVTNELKVNNKIFAREIIPDLDEQLRRLGYQGLYVRR